MTDTERKELRATPGCKPDTGDSGFYITHDLAVECAEHCDDCLDLFVAAVRAVPPKMRDLLGIAPDLTGGMESTAYVRQKREAADAAPRSPTGEAETPDTMEMMREALVCAEYALSHPESNQSFPLSAVRTALSAPPPPSGPPTDGLLAALKVLGIEPPCNPGEEWTLDTADGPDPSGDTAKDAAERFMREFGAMSVELEEYQAAEDRSGPPRREPLEALKLLQAVAPCGLSHGEGRAGHALLHAGYNNCPDCAVRLCQAIAISAWAGPVSPSLSPETVERVAQLIVKMAIPYEALWMDEGSRKWIAPEIWKDIVEAIEAARTYVASLTKEEQDTE